MKRFFLTAAPASMLLLACATATQQTYIAPTRETVYSTTEAHDASPVSHVEYVENHSTVPIIVFAITVTNCENVKVTCGVKQVHRRIDAGNRDMVLRVEPQNTDRAWSYAFGFSWHPDSSYGTAALNALAQGGDSSVRVRLAAMQHADSLRKAETGPHYNDLSRTDFSALAGKVASMRAYPESLLIAPGERVSIERIRLLLVDKGGVVLGQTRWVKWRSNGGPVQFLPPDALIAKRPGRTVFRYTLADEAQQMLGAPVPDLDYNVIAAYPPDPHAPMFEGRALDADSKQPLACAAVALEDSAQNIVARERTAATGTFLLTSPRPGTYRVRVETPGWAPAYGPDELAKADEDRQHEYLVRFTDRMLAPRYMTDPDEIQHAHPVSLRVEIPGRATKGAAAPVVSNVTLGGSEAMPILGIVGRAPAGTMWMQFVVDSAGQVEAKSIALPLGSDPKALASVTSVLPRVHFAAARESGKPVCELLRMQVNFSSR
ncbi:MAG TPA: carboxypeptidase-like regulatory domain-containing protein [Gemmatimonadaceae bacterium]|nr:carboxypeptidase-like regulatory domain-containing protein [Gemmatimonadaceae bacterium]